MVYLRICKNRWEKGVKVIVRVGEASLGPSVGFTREWASVRASVPMCTNTKTTNLRQSSWLSVLNESASERRNRYFSLSIWLGDNEYFCLDHRLLNVLYTSASETRNRYFSLSIFSFSSENFSFSSSSVERSVYECEWDKTPIFLSFYFFFR